METPLLAAALIVKNEQSYLPDCLAALNALRPLLSEICIYDTGSTDATVRIAQEAGARVELGYWDDDFSRARNAAIGMCDAKWVLIVDADERIIANARGLERDLRERLRRNLTGDALLRVQCDMISREGIRTSSFMSPRILRPSRIAYVGRVHEVPQSKPGVVAAGKSDLHGDVIRLRHIGYVAEAMAGKGKRNLALAEAEASDAAHGGREMSEHELMNRARSKRLSGDLQGSISDLRALRRRPQDSLQRRWAGEMLAGFFADAGDGFEARPLLRELEAEGCQAEMHRWLTARLLRAEERYAEALELLRSIDVPVGADGGVSQPADLLEARFHCAVNCGEVEEAIACGIRLVAQYARQDPFLPMLLRLWGTRPIEVLAQLIVEFGEDHAERVRAGLKALGHSGADLDVALSVVLQGQTTQALAATSKLRSRGNHGSAFGIR